MWGKVGVRYSLRTHHEGGVQRDIVGNKTQAETVGCQIGYRTRTKPYRNVFSKVFCFVRSHLAERGVQDSSLATSMFWKKFFKDMARAVCMVHRGAGA